MSLWILTSDPCFLAFLLFHSSYIITIGTTLNTNCSLGLGCFSHQCLILCCICSPSIEILAQEANSFHSFWTMEDVRKTCVIVSWWYSSQQWHLDTKLMCILWRLSSVGSLLFHSLHRKKLILKGSPFIETYSIIPAFVSLPILLHNLFW